jgi:hypothetical protein
VTGGSPTLDAEEPAANFLLYSSVAVQNIRSHLRVCGTQLSGPTISELQSLLASFNSEV